MKSRQKFLFWFIVRNFLKVAQPSLKWCRTLMLHQPYLCAGLQKPDYMPGKSIIQLLKGDTTNWRDKIFYEYYWEYDFPMTPTVFGVRTDKYKYMHYKGIWDTNELYDIENDPDETTN